MHQVCLSAALALCLYSSTLASAQTAKASPTPQDPATLGVHLADSGKCPDALPYLKRAVARSASNDRTKTVATAGIRCAMLLNQQDDALDFLRTLRRQFPRDPEVQYLSTHVFSDLSIRASQELLFTNPSAYQVHQLNAEALETQGRWDDAMSEYRAVLEKNPQLPDIHYRIGRLILSKPKTDTTFRDAKKEFEEELTINPKNPGAEYVLGEIARQQDQWPEAIEHFAKAVQLDSTFVDALIGWGRALTDGGKPDHAVAPLERAAKLQSANPAVHYHLAIALDRAGKKDEANKEFALYKQTSEQARQLTNNVQAGVLGPQQVGPDVRQ